MRNKKLIILFSVLLSITLLVVLNSVIFSVQHVDTYCLNVPEKDCVDSRELILSSHKIRKGSSIFGVKESKVISSIEANAKGKGIRVLNIERKFPNRVCINYVEVKPYLKVYYDGVYYLCDNDMHIVRITETAPTEKLITLRYSGDLPELHEGDTFVFGSSKGINTIGVLSEIFSGFERLGYYEEVVDLFYEIDVSGTFIKLYTRRADDGGKDVRGMEWQILTPDNLADKLRLALSTYNTLDAQARHDGYLKVTSGRVEYSEKR